MLPKHNIFEGALLLQGFCFDEKPTFSRLLAGVPPVFEEKWKFAMRNGMKIDTPVLAP